MPLLTIAFYELLRLWRMRLVMFTTFLLPILLIYILGFSLSTSFSTKDRDIEPVKVSLFNAGQSAVTERLQTFLREEGRDQYIKLSIVSTKQQLEEEIREKRAHFGVYIPPGFAVAVDQAGPPEWEFILGRSIPKNKTAEAMFRAFLAEWTQNAAVSSPSPLVEVKKLNHYTAVEYYAAHMLVMFLFYSGIRASSSLMNERFHHTLLRLQAAPVSPLCIVGGKLLGNGTLAAMQCVVIILTAYWAFDVHWGESALLLALVCLFTIVISMGLAILFAALSKNESRMTALFHLIIVIMTFLNGGYYPEAGGYLESVSRFTPSYWSSSSLIAMMVGSDAAVIGERVMYTGAIAALFLLLIFLVYRKSAFVGRVR